MNANEDDNADVEMQMPSFSNGEFQALDVSVVTSHFVIPNALCNKLLSHFVITCFVSHFLNCLTLYYQFSISYKFQKRYSVGWMKLDATIG